MCYFIANTEMVLNEKQIASARSLVLENLSSEYNEFAKLSDVQKQIKCEEYILLTMKADYYYKKGKSDAAALNKKIKEGKPNDVSSNVYDAMSMALTTSPDSYATKDASTVLVRMLSPIDLRYQYILTDEGFIKK